MSPQASSFIEAATTLFGAEEADTLLDGSKRVQAGTLLGEVHRSYCELVRLLGPALARDLFAEFLRDCLPAPGEEPVARAFFAEHFDAWRRRA
jgi:hypothetical protein